LTAKKWRITILVNNTVPEGPFIAEHGLSMMIADLSRSDGRFILFDAGQRPDTILRNSQQAGVDWSRLDNIILSHAHYDHNGGLPGILSMVHHPVSVIGHPETFLRRVNDIPFRRDIGTSFSKTVLLKSDINYVESEEAFHLSDDLILTGEIPRRYAFESESLRGLFKEEAGEFVQDIVADDKSLIIRSPGRGFYLICGCCHAGMMNTIRHASDISGEDTLLGIMGGFHLSAFHDETLVTAVQELEKWNPRLIIPLHCTGMIATAMLWNVFGKKVKFLGAGDHIDLD